MTKFLKNVDVTGYVSQTSVTSSLVKTDANGKLVAAVAGTDFATPGTIASADKLIREVYNKTGATLTKGTVVYINDGQGNLPAVTKAIATGDSTSAQTFGIVQADITNNNNGYVVVSGGLDNMNTNGLGVGTALYLSSTTAGAYTTTKQYAPAHLVYIGVIVRDHPTQGVIEIKIQNGYELDEIHNVAIATLANNHTLVWESATSLWKNKTIAAALGYTPADDSAVVKLTGDQTVGGVKTFTASLLSNNPSEGATGEGLIAGQSFKIDGTGTGQRAIMYVVSRTLSDTYASGLTAQYSNFAGDKAFGFNLNTVGGFELYVKDTTFKKALAIANTMAATFGDSVTATSFIKSGGTSAQFLKADGSVDSSTYLTTTSAAATYLALAGGTMTGKILSPSVGDDVYGGAIEFRERAYASNTQSAWSYSPSVTFHWGNRHAKRFGMRSDGLFAIDDEPLALRSWVTAQAYLTSYTETDTLATVTGRGASTSTALSLSGKVTFASTVANRPQMPGGILGLDTDDGNFDIWGISRDYYPSHATAANAWGLRWNGDNNDFEFVGGGTSRVILDMDSGNITATGSVTAGQRVQVRGGGNGTIEGGYLINSVTASTASRKWLLVNDSLVFGDFAIAQSTTQTGDTYANQLYFNASGAATFSNTVTSTATTNNYIAQSDGTSAIWRGRILSKNATADLASFLGTYGSVAGVFSHNNALSAWAALYVNNVDGTNGGAVYLPTSSYVAGNAIVHAGNIASQSVSSATTVTHYSGRTDATAYNVVWASGNPSHMYSCDAVKIQSSTGTLFATTFSGTLSGNAATSTYTTYVSSPDGTRNPNTFALPNSVPNSVQYDFATAGSVTGATGNYAGVMTYAPWDGTSASTGDSSYQLAFCNYSGVNASGLPGLALRNGINSGWNSTWYQMLHSGNWNLYAPGLTGGGASGTWGINITGNAATASSAPNGSNINNYYNSTAGEGYGFRFWNGDENYKLSMGVGAQYQYGPVNDYSIKLHMGSGTGRGITMGVTGGTPTFAHNTTSGNTQVAGYLNALNYVQAYGDMYLGAGSNGQVRLSTERNRNLFVYGTGSGDVGIAGRGSANQFGFQIYGDGAGNYGFLDGVWGGWAIKMTTGGALTANGSIFSNGYQVVYNSGTWGINISGNAATADTSTGTYRVYLDSFGTGSVDVNRGYSCVLRNENGSGGNFAYAPVLHLGGSDTMWQIQGNYGGQTGLKWRSGYAGTWYGWWTILHEANQPYAYSMNQHVRTTDSVNFAQGVFGSTGGATDQGIQIRYQNYNSGYGRIRFYQSDSNHMTIHAFSASWQGGGLGSGNSAGGINIAGENGVTFGGWNVPDAYIATGGAGWFRGSLTATSFFESSDATIKTLIIDNYQAKGIESVEAKLYIKNGKQELGYYAQDLQDILPSSVTKGDNGLLNLSYREVHTAKIARLEKEVEELKSQLARL